MSWRRKKLNHQQPWYWLNLSIISRFQRKGFKYTVAQPRLESNVTIELNPQGVIPSPLNPCRTTNPNDIISNSKKASSPRFPYALGVEWDHWTGTILLQISYLDSIATKVFIVKSFLVRKLISIDWIRCKPDELVSKAFLGCEVEEVQNLYILFIHAYIILIPWLRKILCVGFKVGPHDCTCY